MVEALIRVSGELHEATSLDLPTDRTFRNAWQLSGDVVEVDMPMARDIHRDSLRLEREPLFAKLDADWFRAAEANDQEAQAGVASKKQALRDVTSDPRIEAAATPDELRALTLDELLK